MRNDSEVIAILKSEINRRLSEVRKRARWAIFSLDYGGYDFDDGEINALKNLYEFVENELPSMIAESNNIDLSVTDE